MVLSVSMGKKAFKGYISVHTYKRRRTFNPLLYPPASLHLQLFPTQPQPWAHNPTHTKIHSHTHMLKCACNESQQLLLSSFSSTRSLTDLRQLPKKPLQTQGCPSVSVRAQTLSLIPLGRDSHMVSAVHTA